MCILKFESNWLDDAPNEFTIYLDRKSCKNLKKKKKEREKSLSKGAKCYKDAKRGGGKKWLKHSLKSSMRS